MPESKEIWCVAGNPCTGRRELCADLKKHGFAHFERDKYGAELLMKLVELTSNLPDGFSFSKPLPKEFRPVVELYRAWIAEHLQSLQRFGDSENGDIRQNIGALEELSELNGHNIVANVLSNPATNGIIMWGIANKRALEAASSNEKALVDSCGLVYSDQRTQALNILNSRGIDPGLLIVQNTRKRMLMLRRDQKAEGKLLGVVEQDDASFLSSFNDNHPYDPSKEKWSRVAVVNNSVPKTAEEVREALLRATRIPEDQEPIPFVI